MMIHSQQCFSFSFSIDDDNFFHHLRSIHKCAIKYVQKYFLNARGQPRKWLLALFYGVLLQLQLLPGLPGLLPGLLLLLLMLFCLCQCCARLHHQLCLSKHRKRGKLLPLTSHGALYPAPPPSPHRSLSNEVQRGRGGRGATDLSALDR